MKVIDGVASTPRARSGNDGVQTGVDQEREWSGWDFKFLIIDLINIKVFKN